MISCLLSYPHQTHNKINVIMLISYPNFIQLHIISCIYHILAIKRVLQLLGIYPNWLSWIFTIILNISVSLALYSLVIFYHVFAKELAPHKPLAKFLCIKGIVFFCFWQVNLLSLYIVVGQVECGYYVEKS
jgi:hypothetical protein